jgi:hypothetical protein
VFEIGSRVRTRAKRGEGHTRLPAYLQLRDGRIVAVLGRFRFADEGAVRGTQARDEMLYTVEFGGPEHTVRADLFEPYLEAMT